LRGSKIRSLSGLWKLKRPLKHSKKGSLVPPFQVCNFTKVFEAEHDVLRIGIGEVLIHEGRPKLNSARS